MKFWHWIQHLDRRWIFIAVAIVVAVPILFPLGLPVQITRDVRGVFDFVETFTCSNIQYPGETKVSPGWGASIPYFSPKTTIGSPARKTSAL